MKRGIYMRIVICDDDDGCCSQIETWILEYGKQKSMNIEVEIYNSAEALLKHIEKGYVFDGIYLDIELPNKNGVELGHIIREKLDAAVIGIIFISGKTQYCIELFELEPLNFHQKPLRKEWIEKDLDKIVKRRGESATTITYRDKGLQRNIFVKDVVYIESNGNMLDIILSNGEIVTIRGSLSRMSERYEVECLVRCHKSYMINLNYVDEYQHGWLFLRDQKKIPVGKKYLEETKKKWAFYGMRE